jgi:hypothetical protein
MRLCLLPCILSSLLCKKKMCKKISEATKNCWRGRFLCGSCRLEDTLAKNMKGSDRGVLEVLHRYLQG